MQTCERRRETKASFWFFTSRNDEKTSDESQLMPKIRTNLLQSDYPFEFSVDHAHMQNILRNEIIL